MPYLRNKRYLLIFIGAFLTTLIMMLNITTNYHYPITYTQFIIPNIDGATTFNKNWRNLNENQTKALSKLGRILYLDEPIPKLSDPIRKYTILVWKYGSTTDSRHMKQFGNKRIDPFDGCSVNNCQVTYDDRKIKMADMIIFHLHRIKNDDKLPTESRAAHQIWTFLTDESPYHTFMKKNKLINYNGVFNWSMTYRMDSDIPVPYGRTVPLMGAPPNQREVLTKRTDVLVAIMGSNCGGKNHRWDYVKELQRHIRVDVYGGCGPIKTCPGHFRNDCPALDNYLFYLSFENSNCKEYMTEKLFWNAYHKNTIPIIMGVNKEDSDQFLPPNSYLNVEDYAHPKDLASYLLYLNQTGYFKDYYGWKSQFRVVNEHGYFQSKSYHYCRACEALNYNDRSTPKVYTDLGRFWNTSSDCRPAWNT